MHRLVARSLAAVVLAVALGATLPRTALAAKRIALVVGNADYATAPLRNPVNDARAMSAALRRLGFDVISLENATSKALQGALGEFSRRLSEDATGLFYFAGHGVQVRGRNFLVPVDAKIDSAAEVRFESVDLSTILEEMAFVGNRLNIVILDACRNNPFERSFRGGTRGLASVEAGRGTLIAYATAPGSVAADGKGQHGVYTEELLDALKEPGLQVEEIFKRVRIGVSERTDNRQIPWESSSLTGSFVFKETPAAPLAAPAPTPAPASTDRTLELAFWSSIAGSDDPAAYRAYLEQFPVGTFAPLARLRIAKLTQIAATAPSKPPVEPAPSKPPVEPAPSKPPVEPVPSKPPVEPVPSKPIAEAAAPDTGRPDTAATDPLERLLVEAEADLAALRLTSPKGNNAFERYRQALVLQPGEPRAARGIERIGERYVGMSDHALARGDLAKSRTYLDRAERVAPGSAAVQRARERLSAARDRVAASSLAASDTLEPSVESATAVDDLITVPVVASAPSPSVPPPVVAAARSAAEPEPTTRAPAPSGPREVSASEAARLLVGNTFEGKNKHGVSWRTYMEADGTALFETFKGWRDVGTWQVSGDALCFTYKKIARGKTTCMRELVIGGGEISYYSDLNRKTVRRVLLAGTVRFF